MTTLAAGIADPLGAILQTCSALLDDVDHSTVHAWQADQRAHGNPAHTVGHFQVYFPEEIVHAAGMLPIAVMGAGSNLEAKRADSHIGSFICSICRTSLELGLSGRLDFLDAFYTTPICDVARNLAGIWGRNFPEQTAEIVYIPQNANSRHSVEYLRNEYARVLAELEGIVGKPVEEADIRASIGVFNQNRRLIRQLYQIKRETPWMLDASEAFMLVKAGRAMPKEQHNTLLETALAELSHRDRRRQDRVRVVFEGGFCEQPPLDMLQLIEESCYIVDDDLLIGMRWITDDVPQEGDPLYALAESYIERSSYSCVQHDSRKPKEEMLLQRIKSSGAEAAILAAAKMCEPGMDEQVAYQQTLEAHNIPFLLLEFEERMSTFERLRMEVETFVESILFD
jgi:benzoyl-CoA reductase subunit C